MTADLLRASGPDHALITVGSSRRFSHAAAAE
jgi:hypothetical protein